MPGPEARVVINRSPDDATPGGGRLKAAREANEQRASEVRRRRKSIHDQARQDAANSEATSAAAPIDPPPPREDVESIEITLRTGMVIEYGPPTGISLLDRIARMYGGRDPSVSEFRLTRILMGIRSIDGKPVAALATDIDRTRLANRIGDEAIDLLFLYDREYWPPLQRSELPLIKKNLRT